MNINEANNLVIDHLKKVVIDSNYNNPHISKMLDALSIEVFHWSSDKTSRWIGFIQGVLYTDGIINLDEERNFTRPIYHTVHKNPTVKLYD